MGVKQLRSDKKTKEKVRAKHSKVEEKPKRVEKPKKIKKKASATIIAKRVVITILCMLLIASGTYVGYGFYNKKQSGIGLSSALLATLLGESSETIKNLQPIQVLIMGVG